MTRRVIINVGDGFGVWAKLGGSGKPTAEQTFRKLIRPGTIQVHRTPAALLARSTIHAGDQLYQQLVGWVRQTFTHRTLEERHAVADKMFRKANEDRSFWLHQPVVLLYDAAMHSVVGTKDCACKPAVLDAAKTGNPCHDPKSGKFAGTCSSSTGTLSFVAWKKEMREQHPDVEFEEHPILGILAHTDGTPVGHFTPADFTPKTEKAAASALSDQADAIAAMPESKRDNMEVGQFEGAAQAYKLYEARKLLSKPSDKLKKVTDNNSWMLWQDFDYVANVDGQHYGITKQEDPDNDPDDDDAKGFVYAYEKLDAPVKEARMMITVTSDISELFGDIRAGRGTDYHGRR